MSFVLNSNSPRRRPSGKLSYTRYPFQLANALQAQGDYDEESAGCRSIRGLCPVARVSKDGGVHGRNFAKMTDRMGSMTYGPKKRAMMRQMAIVNTDMSNGDMRGACRHYVIAQRIQNNAPDPFMNLHFE